MCPGCVDCLAVSGHPPLGIANSHFAKGMMWYILPANSKEIDFGRAPQAWSSARIPNCKVVVRTVMEWRFRGDQKTGQGCLSHPPSHFVPAGSRGMRCG